MAERMTIDELKSYLWQSAVLLRTNIDAGAYKQYIFPLLFFKRICDVYDEETQKALAEYGDDVVDYPEEELHTFIVPKGHHWEDVRRVTEDVGRAIVTAFKEIEKANGDKMTGIFGDGAWTNKNRLPDRLLKDLLEHFSSRSLSLANCPEDELGNGYEYLIKQFADDSGHTAQEFYTNRTVVHLMTEILQPQSGESVYDPTCGSAGMLISCIAHLKKQGKEWRNLQIYGQEINQLTCAIGRMNLFLHGIVDFNIANDDTLKTPSFIENGKLKKFDIVLANPPYSISQWDRAAFENDKYGRNTFGTPPQSRADYAFIQHIIASLQPDTGRAAILLPHGVLNRNEEKEIRKAIIASDCVDAVIGLGRHLFYNSGLESCILILRAKKPDRHKRSILFIEAEKCTHKVQSQNYLFEDDITRITQAYFSENDIPDFSRRVSEEEILANDGNLNIKLYVNSDVDPDDEDFTDSLDAFMSASVSAHAQYREIDPEFEESPFGGKTITFEDYDPSSWRLVKLSDVAEEYSERIDDPANSDYEWYIGSDCIDGFAFTISRKQDARKIHSAQKSFKAGDYLLVRRSLYGSDFRERAPRADFDGICSADILTIREKQGAIVDGYLIAVLYSKKLWKFIVSNSTGSLTRRIKWNQLKDFEFYLPPVEKQQEIVDVLWAMERVKSAYKELIEKTDDLVKSQFAEMFDKYKRTAVPLKTVCIKGPQNGFYRKGAEINGTVPVMKMKQLFGNESMSEANDCDLVAVTDTELERFLLTPDDLLFGRRSLVVEGAGKCRRVGNITTQAVFESSMLRVTLDSNRIKPRYLQIWFDSEDGKSAISGIRAVTTIAGIKGSDLANIEVPVAPVSVQEYFLEFVEQTDKSKF
ncbi:MAG: N-6 DNA methylase, partial [Thermoguttaceae bacterium]|nr:N-6 DNA methylase [Thermoguttaceae bacterium]